MPRTEEKKNKTEGKIGKPDPKNDLIIVGIGASAGGLDALQKLLPCLPAKAGMAYIIVQHLSPKRGSMLTSILAKHTEMKVDTIRDGVRPEPDTIYITPPNKDVRLDRGRLQLLTVSNIGPRPSIDYFFNSLSEEKGARAVGIILSGTGTDGAHGIRAIKSNDGITMAQTAESAKFDGMPLAALNTGYVDLVLPPEKIGREIEKALKYPNLIASVPLEKDKSEFDTLLKMLRDRTGVDFSEYKPSTLHRRLSRRMVINKIESLKDYVAYVREYPEELSRLRKDLLISVTSFFRDPTAFEALSANLEKLLENKHPGDCFRAWVPGCATGEEAYSIAILIAEILGEDLSKYRVQIFATDIDDDSVQLARKGIYPLATVMETDGKRFEKYFSHHENTVTVKKFIRDMVVLARQDLTRDTPFLHLDLISCRNLMIYLNFELQNRLISLFQFSLNPKGLLFLGKSENINKRKEWFKVLDKKWKIYQRRETGGRNLPKLMRNRHMAQLTSHREMYQKHQQNRGKRVTALFDSLLDAMEGCAVLADHEGNILHIRGQAGSFFQLPVGNFDESINVLEAVRPEFRNVFHSLLHKFSKENTTITSKRLAGEGGKRGIQIKIAPVRGKVFSDHRIILFSLVEPPKTNAWRKYSVEEGEGSYVRELEQELEVTREHLQDTIEELETSSEELQSLNEELQASNEELQASNEQLETSNEELQASNEELNTVNDELRAKSEEATGLLEELKISEKRYRLLVDNMNEGVMTCEIEYGPGSRPTDLIIKHANLAMEHLISIDRSELPLRAGSVNLNKLISEQNISRIVNVSRGGPAQRFEVHCDGIGKELLVSVYNVDEGLVGMICRDETERNRAIDALERSEEKYRELVQNANSAIIRWDRDGTLTFFNEYAQKFFGYDADEVIGKNVGVLVPKRDSHGENLTALVENIVTDPEKYKNNINENIRRDGKRVWMAWTNKPVFDENGKVSEILAVGTDITKRKEAEKDLWELKKTLEQKVAERTELAEKRTRELQALSVELIETEERERQRLAQLLHDDLQQLLASARLRLQTVCGTDLNIPELNDIENLLEESIRKARNLSHELSPPVLDHAGLLPALQWLAQQMKEKFGLEVELEVDTNNKLEPSALNVFMFRAVNELLFNVVKHAGEKKARVKISDADNGLVIIVSDDGKGFDRKVLENAAEPGGFGLLSLKERARSIGGQLKIDSTPAKGSRLELTVPLNFNLDSEKTDTLLQILPDSDEKPSMVSREHDCDDGPIRVLVADDHKVMRQGLVGLMESHSEIEVVGEAGDGRQALEQARKLRPDLVLMDVSMPEMDGIEATRRIKSEMPSVRIVGLSMHEDGHTSRSMLDAGAEVFLNKAASSAELLGVICQKQLKEPKKN